MLNFVNRVQVGLSSGADNGVTTLTGLGRGDLLVLDSEMTPIVAAPADNAGPRKSFYVAVGTGETKAPFIMSAPIFGDNVVSANYKATRVAADQVSAVSIITPAVGDVANIVIVFKDRQRLIANRQTRLVLTAEAATIIGYDLASDLAKQATFSSPYSDPYGVKVEVTTAGTDSVTEIGQTIAVTKGSDRITFSVAAEHGTNVLFAVGDYIDISGVTYAVAEVISTTVLKLDRLYTGDSDAALANTEVNERSTLTAVNIQVTGVASPYNNPEIDVYEKPVFEIGSDQVGAVVTNSVAMDLGQGIYEQVKAMEFAVQGYLGNSNLRQWPIPTFDYHAVSGTAYNVLHIMSKDKHEGDLQNMMESPVGLSLIFSNTSAAQENDITAILDPLIPGFSI